MKWDTEFQHSGSSWRSLGDKFFSMICEKGWPMSCEISWFQFQFVFHHDMISRTVQTHLPVDWQQSVGDGTIGITRCCIHVKPPGGTQQKSAAGSNLHTAYLHYNKTITHHLHITQIKWPNSLTAGHSSVAPPFVAALLQHWVQCVRSTNAAARDTWHQSW